MYIKQYEYLTATIDCGDHLEIEGIDRSSYTVHQFLDKVKPIRLSVPTAVLYSAGATTHQSETRQIKGSHARYKGTVDINNSSMVLKELSVYNLHKWIGSMENNDLITYANINGNTCASSMHSIYEAERLLRDGVCEEVVVITEERTSFNTIRIFKEHNIPLVVSDGLAVVVFTLDPESGIKVTDTKWGFKYENNPFKTTVEGYSIVDTPCPTVKPHGTNTMTNDVAEEELTNERKVVSYKKDIGHSQGASSLVELCMLIDDKKVSGDILCVASGLGGFYGSCILHKR